MRTQKADILALNMAVGTIVKNTLPSSLHGKRGDAPPYMKLFNI
jgi:hypothetical protein